MLTETENEKLFAKASRIDENKKAYHTPEEWNYIKTKSGVKVFKRKLLGLCGRTRVKSLDEIAQALHETGIASSLDEGKEIVPSLLDNKVCYERYHLHDDEDDQRCYETRRFLSFKRVMNGKGEEACRISLYGISSEI